MIYSTSPLELSPLRQAINLVYLADEHTHLESLLAFVPQYPEQHGRIEELARELVLSVRAAPVRSSIEALLQEYDLSSQEGVMLMCLAEALLRIPDDETADRLIKDKLSQAEWDTHIGASSSVFVNASTWGLILTGRFVKLAPDIINNSRSFFSGLVARSGEPVIRLAIRRAMRIIGQQFVLEETVEEALNHTNKDEHKRYRHSFDMLGEAAITHTDSQRYFLAYANAIKTLGRHAQASASLFENPGISIKLSALYPRYEWAQRERVLEDLPPNLLQLARLAKQANINLTLDAEEAERLDLLLDIFETIYRSPELEGWNGFGLALQAYQKRAIYVIDWLKALALEKGRQIPVRLVKGAYWDTEIKRAQERGLSGYPVFTRKSGTDVSYLACATQLLDAGELFYPQFATHNAHTLASIVTLAGDNQNFEFQRLHGMGEALFQALYEDERFEHLPCRVYAPIGDHKELLPYLVRRLLENGANTSFVNKITDEQVSITELIGDPVSEITILQDRAHPSIPAPIDLYGGKRLGASGINLHDSDALKSLDKSLTEALEETWDAGPIVDGKLGDGPERTLYNPANREQAVGIVKLAEPHIIEQALLSAYTAAPDWNAVSVAERASILTKAADLLESHRVELMALCIREGGRTIPDALNEVREAIDFCRYYAQMLAQDFTTPIPLPGVTGEHNELTLMGRGVFACISPWNFPIAIFTGQIAAALAAGNTVIAKPAGLTPLCAAHVIRLMHQAGVPTQALHLLPGGGQEVGMTLVNDPRIAGVAFTGSTDTAREINIALAHRPCIIPFIAETGGLNSMIIDSSALPEQVVLDVMTSAFNSAGQRCSALRVLFVQDDIAPRICKLLKGAMEELDLGNPMLLNTDIGPVISPQALSLLEHHAERMNHEGLLIKQLTLPEHCESGHFFAPVVYQIDDLKQLHGETFGPILHVIRYQAGHLNQVIDAINATGYGLTLGIHSRIDSTVDYINRRLRVGNAYVNRNMIGAVVGTQPFGGEGLSGTGPKAGGPFYLHRFATERVLTVNTTAVGGNATLLSLNDQDIKLQ